MKRTISILIICILMINILPTNMVYGESNPDYINVKIGPSEDYTKEFILSSDNGFTLYDKTNKDKELFYIKDTQVRINSNPMGEIDVLDLVGNNLFTMPGDGSIIIGSGSRENSIIQVDKNKYRDYIYFIFRDNKITLINHIQIEHYLYGVVPREMPALWHKEALKAQAMVSRSFTFTNINKHIQEGFNLCDTTHCQVYGGHDNEHIRTNEAIDETKGQYVYYNGKVANTLYHSSSGGHTEDSSKVWGGSVPYLVPTEDDFSKNSPHSNWSIKMTPIEVKNKLPNNIYIGEILDMEILKVSEANRVLELKVIGTEGEYIITGNSLRSIFGSTILKSTWFSIDKEGTRSNEKVYVIDGNSIYPKEIDLNNVYILDGKNKKTISRSVVSRALGSDRAKNIGGTLSQSQLSFIFNGKGYGHGVGMSQYGAMEMANLGYNYNDIIRHYYKGVDIINLDGDY